MYNVLCVAMRSFLFKLPQRLRLYLWNTSHHEYVFVCHFIVSLTNCRGKQLIEVWLGCQRIFNIRRTSVAMMPTRATRYFHNVYCQNDAIIASNTYIVDIICVFLSNFQVDVLQNQMSSKGGYEYASPVNVHLNVIDVKRDDSSWHDVGCVNVAFKSDILFFQVTDEIWCIKLHMLCCRY